MKSSIFKKITGVKKYLIHLLIFSSCLSAYFITKSINKNTLVEHTFEYSSTTAFEVDLAWYMDYGLPPKNIWPAGSYFKDGMVFTKLTRTDNHFKRSIKLPAGTLIYYYMLQRVKVDGKEKLVWDSGENPYYTFYFSDGSFIKPGYFIFLAGFLPLLLFYVQSRKHSKKAYKEMFHVQDYIPQFDSIRGIGVLMVIVHHWAPGVYLALNYLPNGKLALNTFFVLSGFLITRILLKARLEVENVGLNTGTALKNFYIRRTLRIFPIYYLVLIVFWFLGDPAVRQNGVYYFTYTSNYLFFAKEGFPERLAHLWSLAVEEQFYIFWPFLMLLVNRKVLPHVMWLFLIIGFSCNFIFPSKGFWVEIFTPTCFDAFAIGGLLSYITVFRHDIIASIQPRFKWIFAVSFLLFVLVDVFDYAFLPVRTVHALLAVSIIYYCLFRRNLRIINLILDNRWLVRMGKISYGIYLYHLFVPELWDWINTKFASLNIDFLFNQSVPAHLKPYWAFLQQFALLMVISIVSWKLIEKPVNSLKRKFENKPKAAKAAKAESEIELADPNTFSY